MLPGGDHFLSLERHNLFPFCIYTRMAKYFHAARLSQCIMKRAATLWAGRKVHQYPDAPPPQVKTGPAGAGFFAQVKVTYN
jgi:hypothetical protein